MAWSLVFSWDLGIWGFFFSYFEFSLAFKGIFLSSSLCDYFGFQFYDTSKSAIDRIMIMITSKNSKNKDCNM